MKQNLYKRLKALERTYFGEMQASVNRVKEQSFLEEFWKDMREQGIVPIGGESLMEALARAIGIRPRELIEVLRRRCE